MKERLIEFLAYLGVGQTKFEEKVGLSRGFVNNIGENITSKSLKKITDVYSELNTNWLKTGEGEMLKTVINQKNVKGDNIQGHNVTVSKADANILSLTENVLMLLKEKDNQINRLITIIEKLNK
jgi:transcriptional regulator CtsR